MSMLVVPQGEFVLARHPVRANERLRAWDAADEYLLGYLADEGVLDGEDERSVLVVNGGQGAIVTALAGGSVGSAGRLHALSDSYVDRLATTANVTANVTANATASGSAPSTPRWIDPFDLDPVDAVASDSTASPTFDVVLIKLPKSAALLEDQLCRIRARMAPGATVIGAAMAKHVHGSTLQLFERRIGTTTTSLARKKARLVFAVPSTGVEASTSPWPVTVEPDGGWPSMVNHANVFSRDGLDIGTRFLLKHLPVTAGGRVVDLGCGNGVVGVALAAADPTAHVTFIDESYMAVASAEATYRLNLGDDGAERSARFVVGDGIEILSAGEPIELGSIDVVVNNPPFHDDHAVGDAIAWQMFTESHRVLRAGGELRVVGNRHLAYHAKLKRIFGNCKVVASNSKFVVYTAIRA